MEKSICEVEEFVHSNTSEAISKTSALGQSIIMTSFILIVVLIKTVYDHLHFLPSYLPESNMLILMGVIFGAVIKYVFKLNIMSFHLSSSAFLLTLLPPIILDAAYSLNDRAFLEVLLPVMIFAFLGTLLNFILIGGALSGIFGYTHGEDYISPKVCFLYSAVIVAVDPVAVLGIFQELDVNKKLYYLVFGESLLNDAVTLVLYNSMIVLLALPQIQTNDYIFVILSFISVSIGGLTIGILIGALSAITTKFTSSSEIVEPVIIFGFAYLAYLSADICVCSGMISIIGCGLMQAIYAFHNLSPSSKIFIHRSATTFAVLSEEVIFLYLGFAWFQIPVSFFDAKFSVTAFFLCLLIRFIVTYGLSFLLHRWGHLVHEISFTEQFVLAYGGLRGAVSFALAMLLDSTLLNLEKASKCKLVLATMFIIFLTVVPMGLTIKPVVKCMKIAMLTEKKSAIKLFYEIVNNVMDHELAAIDAVVGRWGFDYILQRVEFFNDKHVRPLLQKNPNAHEKILLAYESAKGSRMSLCARSMSILGARSSGYGMREVRPPSSKYGRSRSSLFAPDTEGSLSQPLFRQSRHRSQILVNFFRDLERSNT